MRQLWIIFSQAATVCLAVLFVVSTLKPEWLPSKPGAFQDSPRFALVQNAPPQPDATPGAVRADSYHEAVRKAMPSVVNIFTSKEVRIRRNPLLKIGRAHV